MKIIRKNQKIIESFLLSIVPSLLIYIGTELLFKETSLFLEITVAFCAYLITLIIIIVYRYSECQKKNEINMILNYRNQS